MRKTVGQLDDAWRGLAPRLLAACAVWHSPISTGRGRDLVIGWARGAGCTIRIDQIGNIFRAPRQVLMTALAPVAAGSHIDTQPTGGKFDGNYGVLAVLEVFRTLNQHGVTTRRPLEMAIWTNEEGSRFVPVMMGSGVYAGSFTLDHALAATDQARASAWRRHSIAIGYRGSEAAALDAGAAPQFEAYFEAHIEQGPVLEDADIVIGAVTGALGQRWYDVTVTGVEAHAGPTPMALRRDALQAATQLMQETVEIALRHAPDGRGTVGSVDVYPNSRNVIPGRVKFTVDLRNADDASSEPDGPRNPSGLRKGGGCLKHQHRHQAGGVFQADLL